MIEIQPITATEIPSCLLNINNEIKILFNLGISWQSPQKDVERLEKALTEADFVLLSNAELASVGALPLLTQSLQDKDVYCTVGTWRMTRLTLLEAKFSLACNYYRVSSLNTAKTEGVSFPSVFQQVKHGWTDTEKQLRKIHQLNYQETVRRGDLVFVAFESGNTIGATNWEFKYRGRTLAFATRFNPFPEWHLNASTLTSVTELDLLVVDAYDAPRGSYDIREGSLRQFLTAVTEVLLVNQGNVLIPVDYNGRLLELLLLLDAHWSASKKTGSSLANIPIVILSPVAEVLCYYMRISIEWYSCAHKEHFASTREHVFDKLRYVTFESSLHKYEAAFGSRAHLVFATPLSMSGGYSLGLFLQFCENWKNLVVFPETPEPHTFAYEILSRGLIRSSSFMGDFFFDVKLFAAERLCVKYEQMDVDPDVLVEQTVEDTVAGSDHQMHGDVEIKDSSGTDDRNGADLHSEKRRKTVHLYGKPFIKTNSSYADASLNNMKYGFPSSSVDAQGNPFSVPELKNVEIPENCNTLPRKTNYTAFCTCMILAGMEAVCDSVTLYQLLGKLRPRTVALLPTCSPETADNLKLLIEQSSSRTNSVISPYEKTISGYKTKSRLTLDGFEMAYIETELTTKAWEAGLSRLKKVNDKERFLGLFKGSAAFIIDTPIDGYEMPILENAQNSAKMENNSTLVRMADKKKMGLEENVQNTPQESFILYGQLNIRDLANLIKKNLGLAVSISEGVMYVNDRAALRIINSKNGRCYQLQGSLTPIFYFLKHILLERLAVAV